MRNEKPVPSCPVTVRCYDNGGRTADRYTVVYHGNQVRRLFGAFAYVGMSEDPYHPGEFGQRGESADNFIDYPRYSHLGRRVPFASLPEPCRRLVIRDLEEPA